MAQFSKVSQEFNGQSKSLFEVMMLANKDGEIVDQANPLHVSLGSENITITGDVNVVDSIRINNTIAQGIPIKNDNGEPLSVSVSNFPTTQVVSDGGSSLSIDGSVSVSNFPATQTVAGSVSVSNFPATQPISGSVSVSNLPATQTVSGSVSVSNFPATQTVSGSVNIGTMPEVEIKNDTGNPIPVSGSITVSNLPATQPVSGSVSVSNFPATQPVSGSITVSNFPVTQPVSGSISVSNFPATQTVNGTVNIGTIPEVEIKNDTGNPVPVNGTVAATQSGSWTVEVNNDSGNPLPISANTSVNSETNPLYTVISNVASTSKDRMKITSYSTGFFNTFQTSKAVDVWDESLTSGGTSTHDPNRSAVAIAVTSTIGSKVVRQTRNVMRYVPGRPAEYSQAFMLNGATTGIRQRIGMFDDNNGFYFERAATGILYFVIRSNVTGTPTETRIPQSSWNFDKMDGSGSSGYVLDLTKTQLLVVDYEWYGTGAVAFSFVINNQTVRAHTFYHANVLSSPWCSTPFVPMRVEMENVSSLTGSTMYQISSCHSQEAMSDSLGVPLSIATPITGKSLQTQNTYYPVLSIRLKSTNLNAVVLPHYLQAGTLDNTFIYYRLTLNPTLTGAVWTAHPTSQSSVEYDTSATTISGGTILQQGFASSGYNDRLVLNDNEATGNFQVGRSSMGTASDILTIEIACTTSNKTAIAVMNWIEQR